METAIPLRKMDDQIIVLLGIYWSVVIVEIPITLRRVQDYLYRGGTLGPEGVSALYFNTLSQKDS